MPGIGALDVKAKALGVRTLPAALIERSAIATRLGN
jgi:hypothetical protein